MNLEGFVKYIFFGLSFKVRATIFFFFNNVWILGIKMYYFDEYNIFWGNHPYSMDELMAR